MRVRQPKAGAGAGMCRVEAKCLSAQQRTTVAAGIDVWKHGSAIQGGATAAPSIGWSGRFAAAACIQAPAHGVPKPRKGLTERRHVQSSVVVHSRKPFHRFVHALEQRPQPQDGLGRQPRVPRHDNGKPRVGSVAHNDHAASCQPQPSIPGRCHHVVTARVGDGYKGNSSVGGTDAARARRVRTRRARGPADPARHRDARVEVCLGERARVADKRRVAEESTTGCLGVPVGCLGLNVISGLLVPK